MADEKRELLKRMPIFSRCSKAELQSLAMNTDEVSIPAGKTLIVQGQTNHTFFMLVVGEVDVQVRGLPPRRLGPGSFFGEISMIDPGLATATVTTVTPVELLVMSHLQFHNAIKANEGIALRVMAVMAARLRANAAASEEALTVN